MQQNKGKDSIPPTSRFKWVNEIHFHSAQVPEKVLIKNSEWVLFLANFFLEVHPKAKMMASYKCG